MTSVFSTIRKLLELIRFSHTLFALPFALLAAVMAWYWSHEELTFVIEMHQLKESPRSSVLFSGPSLPSSWRWLLGHDVIVKDSPIRGLASAHEMLAFRWQQVVGILFCMVFGRSAAMAFNRVADRKLDSANPRTKCRHLPRG